MADPYIDPGTGVLRNLLGLADEEELAIREGRLVFFQEVIVQHDPSVVPGQLDLAHLRAFHRWLFGGVYEWAGELRTVNIAKGSSMFALAAHLPESTRELFDRLAADGYLRGRDRSSFVTGAASLLGDLNAAHPFREGNGRTQRVFLQAVARQAGWDLGWGAVSQLEMVEASEQAMTTLDAFEPLLARIVQPLELTRPGVGRVLRRIDRDPPAITF